MFGWGAADSKEGGTYVLSKTYGIKYKKVVQQDDVEMGTKGGKGKAGKQYETFEAETPSEDFSEKIITKDGKPPAVCFVFNRYAPNEQTLSEKINSFFTCTPPEPKDLFQGFSLDTTTNHTEKKKDSDKKKDTDFEKFLKSLTVGPSMLKSDGVFTAGEYVWVENTAEDGNPYPKGSPDAKIFVLFTPSEIALRTLALINNELVMMNEGVLNLKFKEMENMNNKKGGPRLKEFEIPSDGEGLFGR